MEIREFAEHILYGRTLDEKLERPGRLTDLRAGETVQVPSKPNRPPGLELAGGKVARAHFPTASQLDHDDARGRVLHFFANHELLAMELMALTLLRFPDAPEAFRRRLVATIRDEQKHMSLYIERMKALGVELGEIPLNSFFWDLLSSIKNPMEFVTGMSLTFEQANLDFSLQYRDAFRQMGDDGTAEIMQTVLVDEVAHVRHGLHFFEKWRSPELSQWEAYREALVFPLTPARAKGQSFSRKYRQDAGLDDDFIDRLQVYSHSKGRPPRVMVFNPDCEAVIAHGGDGYNPPRLVDQLRKDLELLPMFLMGADDVLLVEKEPSPHHLAGLMELGYTVPEFVVVDRSRSQIHRGTSLMARGLAELAPWGWDPCIAAYLKPLVSRLKNGIDVESLVANRRPLHSKAWLAERAEGLLAQLPEAWREQCITRTLPSVVHSLEEVEPILAQHRAAGYPWQVVKAPFGSAGGAALRIDDSGLLPNQFRWIEKVINRQGCVVIEPWYDRQVDLSYLFRVHESGAREIGFSHFLTDGGGRYRGAYLAPFKTSLPAALRAFVYQAGGDDGWLSKTCRQMTRGLLPDLEAQGFTGQAGIDLMIVRDAHGELKVRVPLELNPRMTMGHVATAIARPLGSRGSGIWLLLSQKEVGRTGSTSFDELMTRLQEVLPTIVDGVPRRICQGAFTTNESDFVGQVFSVCVIAPQLSSVFSALESVGLQMAE